MVLPEPSWTVAYKPRKTVYRLAHEQLHFKKKQRFERQRFSILTKRSRVWPVNHLYHDKHTQTKHYSGNPYFLMNKRKILTPGKRRTICQLAPSFFESSLPTWSNLWDFKGPVLAIMLCVPLLLFWFWRERGDLLFTSSLPMANKSLGIFSIIEMAANRSQRAVLYGQYRVFNKSDVGC